MTRDELEKIAYAATVVSHIDAFYPMTIEALEYFANLVAEKEREACAQVGEAFDKERPETNYGRCIAVAIRARGQK